MLDPNLNYRDELTVGDIYLNHQSQLRKLLSAAVLALSVNLLGSFFVHAFISPYLFVCFAYAGFATCNGSMMPWRWWFLWRGPMFVVRYSSGPYPIHGHELLAAYRARIDYYILFNKKLRSEGLLVIKFRKKSLAVAYKLAYM